MDSLKIAIIGINHNETPIEIREKFSFTESLKIDAGNYLLDRSVEEVVIVATCNRSEIYIASEDIEQGIKDTVKLYKEFFKVENTEDYILIKQDRDAVIHSYMVAAGLDSAILGEDQILGQIRDAMMSAMELNFSKKVLNRLFMEMLREGKKIRSEIKISEVPISSSYIGISLIKEKLGTLSGKKALVIGAGEMSKLAITYLEEENLDELYLTNRTHSRVKEIFKDYPSLIPVEYENRYEILKNVDILISATGAPHIIIEKDKVDIINRNLCILDLALPRDIQAGVEDNEYITLYHLDDLNQVSQENQEKREELSEEALRIIKDDVEEFLIWLETIKVDPILESLNIRCNEIKDNRMDYIRRKLKLNKREEKVIEKMLMSALKGIIREPIKTLKTVEEDNIGDYIETVNNLFKL